MESVAVGYDRGTHVTLSDIPFYDLEFEVDSEGDITSISGEEEVIADAERGADVEKGWVFPRPTVFGKCIEAVYLENVFPPTCRPKQLKLIQRLRRDHHCLIVFEF